MKFFLLFFIAISSGVQAQDLKVMTWNVFMLPKPVKNSFQKQRTHQIVETLLASDRDVIFLQEAFSGYFQNKIRNGLLTKFPYHLKLKKKAFPLIAFGPGLYVVSKYPIRPVDQVYFTDCASFDCFATKGAMLVEIELPTGKKVQVTNTHLQSGADETRRIIRRQQLAQIRDLMKNNLEPGVPQLLVGDLNVNALTGEEFSRSLDLLEMKSPALPGEPFVSTNEDKKNSFVSFFSAGYSINCYRKPKLVHNPKLLDHILYQKNDSFFSIHGDKINQFTATIAGRDCPLSDHHSRQIDLRFTE